MNSRKQVLLATLAPLALAISAAASYGQTITKVDPPTGTAGTRLTISGSGFGVLKPRVHLSEAGSSKRQALAVTAFSDSKITAEVKDARLGTFDLTVRPNDKALTPTTAAGAFQVFAPEIVEIAPSTCEPDEIVTLKGRFFGSKKGTVNVGGKAAKVLTWRPGASAGPRLAPGLDTVTFKMPKPLSNGSYPVQLKNRIGDAVAINALTMIHSGVSPHLGKAAIAAVVNGSAWKSNPKSSRRNNIYNF